MISLSIVVPIYNEEEVLPELNARLHKAARSIVDSYEIIYINDGSKDTSVAGLKQLCHEDDRNYYIDFSRNFGHQIAVYAGLDASRGDAVVIIDGDLQDPPEVIPRLYEKYVEGHEIVYARRAKRKGDSWFKKWSAKRFYRVLNKMTNIDIPVDTGDFRLIDRKVVDALKKMPERNKFLRGQIAWLGFRDCAVVFDRDERKYGTTGYPFSKMLSFAIDGITGFSDQPLRFASRAGLFISFFSFLIILYALISYFVLNRTIPGWTSIIISTMFIGGIQLLTIGIIGEYIRRINHNTQNRPLYIIQDTNIVTDTYSSDKNITS